MNNRILTIALLTFIGGSIYFSFKMNEKLDESFKDAETRVKQVSSAYDSLANANDSLMAKTQEDQITIGRYEYMIDLIRHNMDSNKVDKIIRNVE